MLVTGPGVLAVTLATVIELEEDGCGTDGIAATFFPTSFAGVSLRRFFFSGISSLSLPVPILASLLRKSRPRFCT